jgi:transcriptional regulator with XRE-family HTH domain
LSILFVAFFSNILYNRLRNVNYFKEDTMETVTRRLIELREGHGLNKLEMAKKLGVSKSTITRYETGDMKPNIEMLIRIKEVFGVSIDWIAGFDVSKDFEYGVVVADCMKSDITPNDLNSCVEFIKKTRKG